MTMEGWVRVSARRRENDQKGFGRALSCSRALRRSTVALVTVALSTAVLTSGGLTPTAVAAPPAALTVAQAKAQIEQLQTEAEAIDQDYVGVQEQIKAGQATLTAKKTAVREQALKVTQTKKQVGQVALAQFQNRNVDTAAQIFFTSDDSDNFLSQISTMEKIGENQNNVLQDYQEQQAQLAELEQSTQTDLAVLTKQEQQLATLRADSEQKVAESKKVLAKLTAAEQAAIAAAEKKAAARAKAKAEAAAKTTGTSGGSTAGTASTAGDKSPAASSATGSGRGATALAFARKQLGKPYVFGAAGPGSYDCSGLTSAAWASAGVNITRTSESQFHTGRAVSKSELQPGDLVFYYNASAPSHVGMYVGNGQIIHAPNSRTVVKYAPLDSMPFVGARRPG